MCCAGVDFRYYCQDVVAIPWLIHALVYVLSLDFVGFAIFVAHVLDDFTCGECGPVSHKGS